MASLTSNKMTAFSHEKAKQLILPVSITSGKCFEAFYGETNLRAKTLLNKSADNLNEQYIYLNGPRDTGKTHLLQAYINKIELAGEHSVALFCIKELEEAGCSEENYVDIFSSFENYTALAIDNIDAWLKQGRNLKHRQQVLFNLFNHYKDSGKLLILSASKSVLALELSLPDLFSRLSSGLSVRLNSYNDTEKKNILMSICKRKGLELNEEAAAYIIKRSDRNLGVLVDLLDDLDRESLAEQRKLTVPFIKKILKW